MRAAYGRVVYRAAGDVHNLRNEGRTRYVNRLIELEHLGDAVEPR